MQIFFSVGEPSGDLHCANLIRELGRLVPLSATGLGGPKMQQAGCQLLRDMSDLAVMGLFPALAKLPTFWRLLRDVQHSLDTNRPDVVVLIDYPGFNWHVARLAKERGIPVVYYGLPQLWAWASWRVRKVQRYVDHALCKLPFEEAWFRDHGCRATYVGHPYFDELRAQHIDKAFVTRLRGTDERIVTILPGSRTQEVRSNLPVLLKAAAHVTNQIAGVRLAVASYNDRQAELARQLVREGPVVAEVFVQRTPELIAAADCCLACSGSVSLELLYHAKPAVISYRLGWLTYQAVRPLINVRHITLVNILASDQPFARRTAGPAGKGADEVPLYPEYPTWRDCSQDIAQHAIHWLNNEDARERLVARLKTLREQVAGGGASARAAQYIVDHIASTEHRLSLRKAS